MAVNLPLGGQIHSVVLVEWPDREDSILFKIIPRSQCPLGQSRHISRLLVPFIYVKHHDVAMALNQIPIHNIRISLVDRENHTQGCQAGIAGTTIMRSISQRRIQQFIRATARLVRVVVDAI